MKKDNQYILALGLLGAGVGGYLWYAKKNEKWPYKPDAPSAGGQTTSTGTSKKTSTTPTTTTQTAPAYAQAKKIYDSLKNGKEIYKKTATSSRPYYKVNNAYTPANVSGTLTIPAGMVDTKKYVLKGYTTSNRLIFMLSGGQYYYLFDANGFSL
jgi:cytoskeletal protein RodZ